MKSLILVCAAALVVGVPFPQTSTGAAKFTSAYTDLKTQCKPVAEESGQGDDVPLQCPGYGGYKISIAFSAASSHLALEPPGRQSEDLIQLATQSLHYDASHKVEWRMAGGKPFAVILRIDKPKDGLDPSEMWQPQNKAGEALVVKGLKGFERIDFEMDARSPNANAKAREMADKAYAGGS